MTARRIERQARPDRTDQGLATALTHVSPNLISGLIEAVLGAPYDGKADLPDIAYEQELEIDELFPVAEALQLLRLAEIEGGDIKLTHMGRRFADADLNERKEILFSRALTSHVPLAAHIRRVLDERTEVIRHPRRASSMNSRDHYERGSRRGNAAHSGELRARFGELFSYDDEAALFSHENPS